MMLSFEFLQRFQGLLQTGQAVGRVGKSGGAGGGAGKNAGRNEILPSHPNVPGYRNKCMHACVFLCVCRCVCMCVYIHTHAHAHTGLSEAGSPRNSCLRLACLLLVAPALFFSLSHFFFLILSHSFSRSLAHFRACSLSLSLSLSLSSVSVCLSLTCLNMASSTRLNMASITLVAHVAVSSRMYIHFDHICVCTCDMNMAHAYI